ncbi:MAG: peptidylprolyl isomerase [Candidatus Latescibacteria bacterium]|nr:peptidylprolyl isomerase [Candidatus Latescibacterota bacterium]
MQIAKDKVVTLEYTLTDAQGEVIDTSKNSEPLAYIQGVGQLVAGLEEALEGRNPGDHFSVSIPAEKGYGNRDEDLVQVVQSDQFGMDDLQVGMQFEASSDDDDTMIVTVTNIEGDQVTIDGNHPLAGVELNFEIDVAEVRDASAEELDHGHVHGPGGHHH